MSNIPHDEPISLPSGGVTFHWETTCIRNLENRLPSGEVIKGPEPVRSALSHTWFYNSLWTKVDGAFSKLDAIKRCKEDIAIYWRFGNDEGDLVRRVPGARKPLSGTL